MGILLFVLKYMYISFPSKSHGQSLYMTLVDLLLSTEDSKI